MITGEELTKFRELVESQNLRAVKRNLDFEKRINSGEGLAEMRQWLGKILLDDGKVYDLDAKAMAFEIGACHGITREWEQLQNATAEVMTIVGPVDKITLYCIILDSDQAWSRRKACTLLFQQKYRKHWAWIEGLVAALASDRQDGDLDVFYRFFYELKKSVCGDGASDSTEQIARYERQLAAKRDELGRTEQDLEFAEDRAHRAHQRVKALDSERKELSSQLRLERENGEKLRAERSRRIKVERQSAEGSRDYERLKNEYVKLDKRLREMAVRASAAEQPLHFDLAAIRRFTPSQILGLNGPVDDSELSQVRRRFAAVFHPDRAEQLPAWVGAVMEEIMGMINEACDSNMRTQ